MSNLRILAIETSCDDSGAACFAGSKLLSNVVASQHKDHAPWSGVVPEVASRRHLDNLPLVVDRALEQAGWQAGDIEAIAVTNRPGLLGSLLVGVAYAKGLAFSLGIPLLAVDHIEAHLLSVDLDCPDTPYPRLGWVVSGGHSHLYLVNSPADIKLLAKTRDDAAGEAYDKLAKRLGLGYPGGPVVEKLSREGNPDAFKFALPRMSDGSLDLSFSGLKTEVMRALKKAGDQVDESLQKDLCAAFQKAVERQILHRTEKALQNHPGVKAITLAGGVACNQGLRRAVAELAEKQGVLMAAPAPKFCTDNAAMIGLAALPRFEAGQRDDMTLDASASHTFAGYRKAARHR